MRETLFYNEMLPVIAGAAILSAPRVWDAVRGRKAGALAGVLAADLIMAGIFTTTLLLMLRVFASGESYYFEASVCIRPFFWGVMFSLPLWALKRREASSRKTVSEGAVSGETEHTSSTVSDKVQYFRDAGLTPREVEIALLIDRRLTNREIGDALFISEGTVKKHVSHIFSKLQVSSREEFRGVIGELFQKQ